MWSDNESDNLLLEAVDRACAGAEDYTTTSKEPIKLVLIHTKSTKICSKDKLRQRTLVEMLDKDYSRQSEPARKKHCASITPLSNPD